jgi:hypothetical protein
MSAIKLATPTTIRSAVVMAHHIASIAKQENGSEWRLTFRRFDC